MNSSGGFTWQVHPTLKMPDRVNYLQAKHLLFPEKSMHLPWMFHPFSGLIFLTQINILKSRVKGVRIIYK